MRRATDRPRVLVVAGYFDWFSGYQETALAAALGKVADTEVIASDRVSSIFSDSQLGSLGVSRRYSAGTTTEHGVRVTRFRSVELRSMVWSFRASRHIAHHPCDLVVQVMPGQLFPIAATLTRNPAPRVALYGDNKAMWSHLPRWQRLLKGAVFAITKGVLYMAVNARARASYAYTPDTLKRLRPFRAGCPSTVMPLAFSPDRFHLDGVLRRKFREDLKLADDQVVIVAAGKMGPQKRIDWLISAFNSVASERPDVHLLLVGADSSAYSSQVRKAVRSSPFRHRTHILPFTDAAGLNAVFNGSDLGVWPRQPAITIQQSMGSGLAVLLPQNDLVGHLIRSGSGRYFELDEARGEECLTEGLAQALSHTDFSATARRDRAEANSWLGADTLARNLLSTAGADR